MSEFIKDLENKRDKIFRMGGENKVAEQHEKNKLTARERINHLLDTDSFYEFGIHAHHQSLLPTMEGKYTPCDGVITGIGKIDGRQVCICAYDFTVMGGSMGEIGERKVSDLRKKAIEKRLPFIWLLDSAGARIQEIMGSHFAGSGALFFEESIMSGSIPMIAAVMGPCAAGTAYIPGLADVVFMIKEIGSMALAGPRLVKAAIGEDVEEQNLGGSRIHCHYSGCSDFEAEDDQNCLLLIRKYLSFFPSCFEEIPPVHPFEGTLSIPEEILTVLPENTQKGFDMHLILKHLSDNGDYLEVKKNYAQNIITCLARIGGRPVGIVANQTKVFSGVIDINASDKAARFINLCDAFNIPLVFLHDTPGFMVGSKFEKEGIIRHGAKMIYAVSNATVPKISVVVRKSYGAGHYAMCSKAFEADLVLLWPNAEISVMGPEGAVNIIFNKQIESAENPTEMKEELISQFKETISPYIAAGHAFVDDVIDPRDTKKHIIRGLEYAEKKRSSRPKRKHGIAPV